MGIVKRVKELFTGKPAKGKTRKASNTKSDPNLKKLSEIAKKQGDRMKLKPAPKSASKAGPKRGK